MSHSQKVRPQVALIVDTSLASGRNILRGITRYVHGHGLWNLFHCPEAIDKKVPAWLKDCENGGIIARVDNPTFAEALLETGAPVVDVLGLVPNTGFPVVQVDDEAIAALAFDHLAERGFRNFAFVGFRSEPWALGGRNWSERRRYVFAAKARAIRCETQVFEFTAEQLKENSWEEREGHLAEWLQALPKPCGILVCNDQFGLDVLEACRRANVHVPDEVAVLGVDNDEPLCDVCTPPLSSVSPGHVGVGYQAAALLDTIMHGGRLRSKTKRVPPGGVVTRQSSEVLAVDDSAVALALRLIRERSCAGISVDEIARLSGTSRSVLQRRFRSSLGQSIHDCIISTRLKHAVELISTSDMSLPEIAEFCGFKHQEYMGVVFRERLGHTPAGIRRASQSQSHLDLLKQL